jgi:hypothetical protein
MPKAPKTYREPHYSHRDALFLAAISADQLQTWYKRGLITEFTDRPKQRGIRRKYSLLDLMYLVAFKEIAAAGVPLLAAGLAAVHTVKAMVANHKAMEVGADVPRLHFVAWWPANSSPVHPSHTPSGRSKGETMPAFDVLTSGDPSIEAWMDQHRVTRVHVIDVRRLGFEFNNRLLHLAAGEAQTTP